jgi:mitochondrial fission protein ELM1
MSAEPAGPDTAAALAAATAANEGRTGATPGRDATPRIWLIVGDRLGDNAQVETLVAGLGLPVERKYVKVVDPWVKGKPKVVPSLHHLDLSASDTLAPPWPDLVITVGRRLTLVALWIREQSGGQTKIALVGKPSCSTDPFALIVVGGEVQIPPGPNVHRTALPLLRVDEAEVARAADEWRERLADLPRPLVGILVGGPTNPFAFTPRVERDLVELARDVVEKQGGTPYVTTSPRTPPRTVGVLKDSLPEGARFFEWRRGAPDNPYRALLGLADGFVVTGDSISMLVEVAKLGKPLAIYPLPYAWLHKLDRLRRSGARWLYREGDASSAGGLRRALLKIGGALHLLPRTRDFTAVHELLIDRGLAVPAGSPLRPSSGDVPNDLPAVVARVRALVGR